MVFLVVNRGVGRRTIFHKHEDFAAFERVMGEAWQRVPVRIVCYYLMLNHWHLALRPCEDEQVGEFTKVFAFSFMKSYARGAVVGEQTP